MVRTLVAPVAVGVTGLIVKLVQVTPEGKLVPTHESVTDWVAPAVRVAVIVTGPEEPCWIVAGPLFESE